MNRRKHRPKLGVVRTPSLEDLLQELWTQRPEIRYKLSTTVTLSIAAFIRENKEAERNKRSRNAL